MRVSFHVKTNLTYDGRVLASIDAIGAAFPESNIRVSLLPDGPTNVDLPPNAWIDEVVVPVRGNRFKAAFRALTVGWYCVVDFIRTVKYRPDVIHVHDKTAAFAPFLYKLITGRRFILIYDDHEIFNKPRKFTEKLFWSFEKKVAKSADGVVVANEQRGRLLKKVYSLQEMPVVVENLYYDRSNNGKSFDVGFEKTASILKKIKSDGKKLLLHQGRILEDRGAAILDEIPLVLPANWMLCIIGVSRLDFDKSELANRDNVLFLGRINFEFLPNVYSYMDGASIFYLPLKLNNRYCAPNRLYQAISFGLPLVVNEGNPVLSNIVKNYQNGVCVNVNTPSPNLKEYFDHFGKFKQQAGKMTGDFDFKISAGKYVSLYQKHLRG